MNPVRIPSEIGKSQDFLTERNDKTTQYSKKGKISNGMNRWIFVTGFVLIIMGACSSSPTKYNSRKQTGPETVTATLEKNHIEIKVGGKLFTRYKFDPSQKYPYFWPVCGPVSNKSITTETSEPYPHHHSLFFGCDRVNGGNYWQDTNERGQIISQGPKLVKASGNKVVFTDVCLWKQPGREPVIRDSRRITISAPGKDHRFIDFKISLKALTDIRILKTNHSLFSARVVPELSVRSGGTIINAEGKTTEKGTWGIASPWCDYWGTRGGITEGIAILQNPDNRWYPDKWFTRDYGFFSPTPMYWLEDDHFDLLKEHILTLRYRVVVHTGDNKTAGIKEIFEEYKKTARRNRIQ